MSPLVKVLIFLVFCTFVILGAMTALSALGYKPNVGENVSPFETQFYFGDVEPEQTGGSSDTPTVETNIDRPVIDDHSRKEGMFNFLVLGRDRVALNTDVIMLISFDTTSGEIAVMQIPRDTYIESGNKSHKINALYAAMYNQARRSGSSKPYEDGMVGFVEALEMNLYTQIDYWAVVNLEGFTAIVDSIGGVEVDIPFDMDYDDPIQGLSIHLKHGKTTLDGKTAEQFVRFRSGYVQADIGRINAQKIFISALLRQIKNNLSLKTVTALAKTALDNTLTSISVADCVYFAKAALEVDMANIKMFTMPGLDARSDGDSGAWYYVMYRDDTLALINRYFNVYESEITDTVFDSRRAFTNEDKPHLNSIYETPASIDVDNFASSAADISENGIDIQTIKK